MGGDGHLRRIHMLWQKMESSQLPKIIQRDGETSQKMTNDVGACGFAFLLEAPPTSTEVMGSACRFAGGSEGETW